MWDGDAEHLFGIFAHVILIPSKLVGIKTWDYQ